jgi:hypothetical protein
MAIGSARPLWPRQVACASRGTASRSFLPLALRSAVVIGDGRAFGPAATSDCGGAFNRAATSTLQEIREAHHSELERVVHPGRSGRGCRRIAWLRGLAHTFRMKSICDSVFINIADLGHCLLSVTRKQSTTHLGFVLKQAGGRFAGHPPYREFDYCPWWALISSSISFFTASRLKVAGACMGGYSMAVSANFATCCCTTTKRQNSRAMKSFR